LRVVEPATAQTVLGGPQNPWDMRDRERTLAKPAGAVRAVFVGDSFVESRFTPLSLPAAVERGMAAAGRPIEAIDLGVSATNSRSYYHRIRDVGLALSPDVLLLFVYAGNGFMAPGRVTRRSRAWSTHRRADRPWAGSCRAPTGYWSTG